MHLVRQQLLQSDKLVLWQMASSVVPALANPYRLVEVLGSRHSVKASPADHRARLSAVTTAAKLLKLSVLNLRAAQPGLMLHLLEEEEISSLEQVLQPLTDICLTSPAAESLADNAVKLITHRELQSRRAAQ